MSEIIEQAINALHAYIPFLPAVKTGHPRRNVRVCIVPGQCFYCCCDTDCEDRAYRDKNRLSTAYTLSWQTSCKDKKFWPKNHYSLGKIIFFCIPVGKGMSFCV